MGPTIITGGLTGGNSNGLNFTRRKIPATHVIPGEKPAGAIPGTEGIVNGLALEYQRQGFWCWAAVGSAVREFFDSAKSLSQCEVANAVMETERDTTPENECCAHPELANAPKSMRLTLLTLGHREKADLGGVAAFHLVQEVVASGEPLVARLAWDTDGDGYEESAHFVLIAGWRIDGGQQYLRILDPDGGGSPGHAVMQEVPYETFVNAYEGSGKWVATYFLKGFASGGAGRANVKKTERSQKAVPTAEKGVAVADQPGNWELYSLGVHRLGEGTRAARRKGWRQAAAPAQSEGVHDGRARAAFRKLTPAPGAEDKDKGYEVRALCIHALNLRALWRHSLAGGADRVVPYGSYISDLQVGQEYSLKQFLKIARREAAKLTLHPSH
jgi:hypothetical protein